MKAVISTAVLALGATAHPNVAPRDPTTITSLLSSVFDAMTNADNLILAYQGGPPIALHQAGEAVLEVLQGGIGTAQNIEALTPGDVAAISCLSDKVTEVGTKYLAHTFTTAFGNVSSEFFTTMKCKYPAESQDAADQEIFGANALFAEVLCALSPPSCVNQIQLPFGNGHCGGPHGGPPGAPHGGPPGGPSGENSNAPAGQPAAEQSSDTSIAWATQTASPCHPTVAPACPQPSGPCGAGGRNGASGANGTNEANESGDDSSSSSSSSSTGPSHSEEAKPSAPAIPVHAGSAGSLSVSGSALALIGAIAFML